MTTAERIIKLFDDSGLEYKQIAQKLGIKPQKISEWKNGTTHSYKNYLDIIAKEFNVTIDYLVNGTITAPAPPPDSKRESIIAMIEPLSDNQLKDLLEYVRFLHWKESQKRQ